MNPLSPPTSASIIPNSTPNSPSSLQHYNSIILTHTKQNNLPQALNFFNNLSSLNLKPNQFTLSILLKSSSILPNPSLSFQLHAQAVLSGLASDPGIRSSLITAYSSFGLLHCSRRVFDEMASLDVPLWNSVMSSYTSHDRYDESFELLLKMINVARLKPNEATYVIIIGACSRSGEIEVGRMVHARMIKERMVDDVRLRNSLITLYSKCGALREAREVFDKANFMNVVSWNAMIGGYEQNGEFEQALCLFRRLNGEIVVVKPNRITYLSVLSAVSSVSNLKFGREVHSQVIRSGLDSFTSIGNSLITMYGKVRDVGKGRRVFDRLPVKDVISWNSMLAGYAQNEQCESCIKLFREMSLMRNKLDDHTITIVLSAISSELSSCKLGREIHGYILRRSVWKVINISVYNAILSTYAKSNRLKDAEKIFGQMGERDSYSWNAMMDGYSVNGCYTEAIELFIYLLDQGLGFDHLTLSILLTVCGRLVSIELGKQIHSFTLKQQSSLCNSRTSLLSINNALISMYSKCGSMADADRIFRRMKNTDVFTWTAMITGYAHQGMAIESLHLFQKMRNNGIRPNSVTMLGLLTACAHSGLVEEGAHYFGLMSKENYGESSVEHYACMVDLFGRSGQFERAEAMIAAGISKLGLNQGSSLPLWRVLLGACHAHKQLETGKRAAAKVLEIEPEDETTHVLLSNLYASFGLWREAVEIRKKMREKGLKKEAGCSWVEIARKKRVFVAGDVHHRNREEIYEKLGELNGRCKETGYVPMIELVLHDVDEVQKEEILSWHSEKLAVSFAVLKAGNARVVRVIKNLRVCGDCHNWMKFVSKIEDREIVLRDSRRFHTFKDGKCSCGDYW
ncbi:pentatricopeptide repeat-containing protein At3g24000, mitochondrial-like [Asparagus officinalis]|uniref:pentatricopeptide repeat-containing protein At3g24000, mitochondrial-like n=1 Tax=Asparagus officinalis TaxID=4686 RepID=UPI00098E2E07|nr:pentatricopeptide repeat-containing protein At3g24000, mitochondrial-like [Asparagus officinalis]